MCKESALENREAAILANEKELNEKASEMQDQKQILKVRSTSIDEREEVLKCKESALENREAAILANEKELNEKASEMQDQKQILKVRSTSIDEREEVLKCKESALENREAAILANEKELNEKASEMQDQKQILKVRSTALHKREAAVKIKESLKVRDAAIKADKIAAELSAEGRAGKLPETNPPRKKPIKPRKKALGVERESKRQFVHYWSRFEEKRKHNPSIIV